MEVTKGLPQSDEVKSEIKPQANGPFTGLPQETVMKIFSHLDVRSAARFAQSQKPVCNFRKQKFSATTDWGVFWITEHSYYEGITYEKGKRMGNTGLDKIPQSHRQKKIGVSIKIEFVPGVKVQADKIGLTQIVQHYIQGRPVALDGYKGKMWVDAEEGYKAHIDVLAEAVDPMYAADMTEKVKLGAKVGSGKADPYHGQWGVGKQLASLIDEPQDRGASGSPASKTNAPNSGQIFETTALALAGAQEGTYYGSVKWGWRTDNEGNFQILPLTVISMGSVSKTFVEAAKKWNEVHNTKQYSNRKLPLPK